MYMINCMQKVMNGFQRGKYIVAYVLYRSLDKSTHVKIQLSFFLTQSIHVWCEYSEELS